MMETTNNASGIGEFSPQSDASLVIGPEKRKLHVDSCVLERSSKPFLAMSKSVWKEGRALRHGDTSIEIPLTEDDNIAFEYICTAIYDEVDMIPEELTTDEVLDISIMVDNYDFMEALSSKSESWLQAGEKKAGDIMILTAAAYLLNNANHYPLDLAYHNAREVVIRNIVELTLINSADNTAGGLMKLLNSQMFGNSWRNSILHDGDGFGGFGAASSNERYCLFVIALRRAFRDLNTWLQLNLSGSYMSLVTEDDEHTMNWGLFFSEKSDIILTATQSLNQMDQAHLQRKDLSLYTQLTERSLRKDLAVT
ncbi:unnamed protein product [Penicillium pancosmium]